MKFSDIQSRSELPATLSELSDFSWELLLQYHKLRDQLTLLRKDHFGKKSEKMAIDSEQMAMDDLFAQLDKLVEKKSNENQEDDFVEVPRHKRRKNKTGRNSIPDDIEPEIVILDVPKEEKECQCDNGKRIIGYKDHKVVEREPAHYTVTIYRRPVWGCPTCKDSISIAEPPVLPIPKSIAGIGLLVFVTLQKYLYHIPLYRIQRQIYHESRIWFTRATMVGWIRELCSLFKRLYNEILLIYQKSDYKYADESKMPIQYDGKGKVHNGFMWVGANVPINDPAVVVFQFSKNRNSQSAVNFIGSRSNGYLMTDDCKSYNRVISENKLKSLLCMTHTRRNFIEAFDCGHNTEYSKWVLRKFAQLYRIERIAVKLSESDTRATVTYDLRQRFSKMILAEIKQKLENPDIVITPASKLNQAVKYMLGNWKRVVRYLEDGNLPIDNNLIERAIRPLTIGRKNWLKVCSENGAQWTAILYTLIATCRVNNVDPHAYFIDILKRLPMRAPLQSVRDLLPSEWIKNREKDKVEYPKA